MLKFFGREQVTPLDLQIDRVLKKMDDTETSDDEYPEFIGKLERLYKLKGTERPDRVSRDALAMVAGNLLGIFLIVIAERTHVMTSKGFTQLIRPKGQ